jgi:gamma-glutamyl hercynylcysteine S-oxide synthase
LGAVLQLDKPLTPAQQNLLTKMPAMTQQPIESYSNEWHFLPQKIVDIAPVKAASEAPEGMKKITGGLFRCGRRLREGITIMY